MSSSDLLLDEYLKRILSEPPKLEFILAPNFARHNIGPEGLLETEDWSESRNEVSTTIEQSGVTVKV